MPHVDRRSISPRLLGLSLLCALLGAACGDSTPATPPDQGPGDSGPGADTLAADGGADPQGQVTLAVKQIISQELDALVAGATALQAGAPAPDADGWNITTDAAAVMAMRQSWRDTRDAYERIEGAIAVLFPNYDFSTDGRYDAFLAQNGPDDNLFDDMNVTGVHAIERILWADSVPSQVTAFESTLDGYLPPAFPSNQAEAQAFKTQLCQKLIDDVSAMQSDFKPLALDLASAYRGVAGSLLEQLEKIGLATTGEDESRYAQRTLADMRANLAGGQAILAAFAPLVAAKNAGALRDQVSARLMALSAAYDQANMGDSLPAVPDDWNPDHITPADMATAFGTLYTLLAHETDATDPTSAVSLFNQLGDQLGIPELR